MRLINIFLAESAVGEYTADIFYVVTIALLTSWVLAMCFLPLLSLRAIRIAESSDGDDLDGVWYQRYDWLLNLALRNRLLTIAIVIAVFVSSISLMGGT